MGSTSLEVFRIRGAEGCGQQGGFAVGLNDLFQPS